MAHTKAGGSTRQKGNRTGKHLGVKKFGGEKVSPGQIIVRQHGSTVKAGENVKKASDYTLFALKTGVVKFHQKLGRKHVSVV